MNHIVINCYFNSEIKTTYIFADELQIEQVITNLILNAADAVEKNGVIEVSIKSYDNNGLIILVKDNGQGISPHDLDKIFSPFYSSKPEGKGTGLGLYIVKNICKSHGIIIECDSEIGDGTTFYLKINESYTVT